MLAETILDQELLTLPAEQSLQRLFHEEPIRLFEARRPQFHCSCSVERTFNALSAVDAVEIESLLEEQGSITMDCEFCNQQYRLLSREDLADVLKGEQPPNPTVLH